MRNTLFGTAIMLLTGQVFGIDHSSVVEGPAGTFKVVVLATNTQSNPVTVCKVTAGQEIQISCGKVLWKGGGSKGTAYTDWRGYYGHPQKNGGVWMALVAEVGKQRVVAEKREFSITAERDGVLILFANDDSAHGNAGKGEVTVTLGAVGKAPAAAALAKPGIPATHDPAKAVVKVPGNQSAPALHPASPTTASNPPPPLGTFGSLEQMIDSAPQPVLLKFRDPATVNEAIAEMNDYLSKNVKSKPVQLRVTVKGGKPLDRPLVKYCLNMSHDSIGANQANIHDAWFWAYFTSDDIPDTAATAEGAQIILSGTIERCDIAEAGGGTHLNLDIKPAKAKLP